MYRSFEIIVHHVLKRKEKEDFKHDDACARQLSTGGGIALLSL